MTKLHVLLAVLCISAVALGKKHRRHEHISKKEDTQSVQVESKAEKPKQRGFAIAIRIPKIGLIPEVPKVGLMPEGMSMDMKDEMKKIPDMKTTTKTENSTNGPFHTYTVTEEAVSPDNKTVMESVKSVTTLDSKTLTPEQKKKLASGELQDDEQHVKIPNLFHWKFRFPFGALHHDEMKPPKPECDEKMPCKEGLYCDEGLCNKKLEPGARCYKKDQCESQEGKYQCTWGVCALNSVPGSPGTFCDDDGACHSEEDMTCRFQNDISPKDKVCLPKLGEEGAFCGKVSFFSFFATNRDFNLCKTGLACKVVGFRGLKRCVKEDEFPATLQRDSTKVEETAKQPEESHEEPAQKTATQNDEKIVFTRHHHKHHRHLD